MPIAELGTRRVIRPRETVNDHVLEIDNQVDGKPEESEVLKVSEDGKMLTIVSRPANSSAVFTMVWDKQ